MGMRQKFRGEGRTGQERRYVSECIFDSDSEAGRFTTGIYAYPTTYV